MAITTYRQRAVAGWASTTPIYQLEAAFAQLGWHGGTVTGIVTGISCLLYTSPSPRDFG